MIEVSDRLHALAHGAVEAARTGVSPAPPSAGQVAALTRSRAMLDTSYAGSPLTGEHAGPGARLPAAPAAGERYPDRLALRGPCHHLLLFGGPFDDGGLERLRRRWHGLAEVSRAGGDPRRAGLDGSGAVLVRPDGYLGFRAAPAGPQALAAVDAHLASYLRPAAPGQQGVPPG